MKAEQARKIVDEALEQLSESLKTGKSEELTRYLSMLAKFHRYSYGNVLLILAQSPEATHVAGFHTWLKLGRHVRKGERGIAIMAPMLIKRNEDLSEVAGDARTFLRFRCVAVFDVAQTDGEPLPEPNRASGEPLHYTDALRKLIASKGIAMDSEDLPMGAKGVSRGGRISIRAGLEPAEEFSVLVHELAHELLHRDGGRPTSRSVRETEAEAVAYVVCQAIGIDSRLAASDYIKCHDGVPATLAASLSRIQVTVGVLLSELLPGVPA